MAFDMVATFPDGSLAGRFCSKDYAVSEFSEGHHVARVCEPLVIIMPENNLNFP
ncbi:hypothetical protein [Agrobacterium larrymoorei]|uniref:Uncharacterized protein n=1 Tax=Agrobacterium larrymoorei TaxID=160699 RepID=A0AAF0HD61_9HYPH|nr:hypothetical protein [Agrobacterium larrymoorei]WHA42153.1 hypothetical protein CFBP5477_005875 [Agrobacterium larrymoorei]